MGYDISYHPISETEMNNWYFELDFSKIHNNDYSEITAIAKRYNIDEFYVNKYIDTVRTMYHDESGVFDLTHGYAIAVIQGLFRMFYYTRGTAFSFLIDKNPLYKVYTKSWVEILTKKYNNPIANGITQNYSSGVYIPADKVTSLLHDYENKAAVRKELEEFFDSNLPVFLKALKVAKDNNMGLLEATEVVEPNPLDLNNSSCYSNLFNCDPEGALIYAERAKKQIAEAIAADQGVSLEEINVDELNIQRHVTTIDPMNDPEKPKKKSFWQKLFGKK